MNTQYEEAIIDVIFNLGDEFTNPLGDSLNIPLLNIITFKRVGFMLNNFFKKNKDFSFLKVFDVIDDTVFNSDMLVITKRFNKYLDIVSERLFIIKNNSDKRYLCYFSLVNQLEFIWELSTKEEVVVEQEAEEDEDE